MGTKLIDREDWNVEPFGSLIREAYELSVLRHPTGAVPPYDSKLWENALAIESLSKLSPESNVLGVGAGLEVTSFMLASRGLNVFASDIYLAADQWDEPALKAFALNPELVFPNYSRERIFPLHVDARFLPFPDEYFDGVYSSGSLEHFGSEEDIIQSIKEIVRVMKIGARASISTEFRISGPEGQITWDPSVYLFTKEFLSEIFHSIPDVKVVDGFDQINPTLVESQEKPTDLLTFLTGEKSYLNGEKDIYPNLLMSHLGFKFCSIHLEIEKIHHSKISRSEKFHRKVNSADAERFISLTKSRISLEENSQVNLNAAPRLRTRLKSDYLDTLSALDHYKKYSRSPIKRFVARIFSVSLKLAGKSARVAIRTIS
jgi:hypothetical protein